MRPGTGFRTQHLSSLWLYGVFSYLQGAVVEEAAVGEYGDDDHHSKQQSQRVHVDPPHHSRQGGSLKPWARTRVIAIHSFNKHITPPTHPTHTHTPPQSPGWVAETVSTNSGHCNSQF